MVRLIDSARGDGRGISIGAIHHGASDAIGAIWYTAGGHNCDSGRAGVRRKCVEAAS